MTATVGTIDHANKSAAVSGTATKNADILVGNTKIATANASGAWSGTITNLNIGTNSVTLTQKVGSTTVDTKTVSVTINDPAENGGFNGTGIGTPVTIPAGTELDVPFGLGADALVTSMTGTRVTATAPTGSKFAPGQTTIQGEFKPTSGDWTYSGSLQLTGTVSADGRTFTGAMADTPKTFKLEAGYEVRWPITVSAPADASNSTSDMTFQLSGTTERGMFHIEGASPVTVKAPVQEIAPPTVTSPANGSTVTTSRPTFTGTGEKGASVTLGYGPNSIIGTTTVGADGKWTINPTAGLAMGTSQLKVVQTSGSNVQTIDHSVVRVSNTVPFSVTSHQNNATYTQGVATFRGTGAEGATIEAKNQWGTVMGTATVKNGQWSFNRNLGPTDNGYDITFVQTLNGEKSEVKLHLVYAGVLGLEVTSPVNNSSYKEGLTTFTGKAMPNTEIVATNQWGTQMGKATTGLDGTWSFVRNLGPTTDGYDITFVATKGTDRQSTAIHLNPEFVNVPVTVTSIKDGATYRPGMNILKGTGTPGASVSAVNATNGWNVPMGTAKVDANGKWELPERNWGPSNDYEIKVTQTNPDKSTSTTTVKIKAPVFAPLVVSGYEVGAANGDGVLATFTGTSTPFAEVQIRSGASETLYQTVEADENGNWSARRTWNPDHVYKLIFDQTAKDGQKDTVNYGDWTAK